MRQVCQLHIHTCIEQLMIWACHTPHAKFVPLNLFFWTSKILLCMHQKFPQQGRSAPTEMRHMHWSTADLRKHRHCHVRQSCSSSEYAQSASPSHLLAVGMQLPERLHSNWALWHRESGGGGAVGMEISTSTDYMYTNNILHTCYLLY